ncbi:DnaJ domain containing protein [Parasponia andersonii]|uniref:DnaJ domain containing protein n=1 Tax=Parasponia andersonii TaxID=3476 RepID=A0A2P5CX64_PARAD|nr:DnaJ domain containing protein [Parasponia andersonii]
MKDEDGNESKGNPWPSSPNRPYQEKEGQKLWGIFLFGLIGATATTFAVGQLRRTVDWFYTQLTRSQSSWKGGSGKSFRSSFQDEAWRRYNRRMQEEYEEEMERVERIRRMQSVFNRERNKYKRSYESWRENGSGSDAYHQQFQRDDWYWKSDTSFRDRSANYRETPRETANYSLSHHYLVLGLDRFRTKPYTDAEIKTAFRTKAKEFHPDQNRDNKEAAEAKFKEVMMSYEAIKKERNTK